MPKQALIALGSNLGDRAVTLANALTALGDAGIRVIAASSIYETEPVGVIDQPRFLNAVCAVETTLSPEALLEKLLSIENANGRVRTVTNGPRTLDLDLLFFESETRATPRLTLPHPRYLEREFVCVPLRELLVTPPLVTNRHWDALREILRHHEPAGGDSAACRLHAKFF